MTVDEVLALLQLFSVGCRSEFYHTSQKVCLPDGTTVCVKRKDMRDTVGTCYVKRDGTRSDLMLSSTEEFWKVWSAFRALRAAQRPHFTVGSPIKVVTLE